MNLLKDKPDKRLAWKSISAYLKARTVQQNSKFSFKHISTLDIHNNSKSQIGTNTKSCSWIKKTKVYYRM